MKKIYINALWLLLLVCGCSNEEPAINTEEDVEFSIETLQMIDSSLKTFTDNMMVNAVEYWKESGEENVTISPLGAAMNLGMLANGSSGENLTEILTAFGGASIQNLNYTLGEIMDKLPLKYDENTSLKMANSVWVNKNSALNDNYVKDLKKYFNATAAAVDLASETGKKEISDWVEKQTDGALKDIYKPAPADFLMLNTLLFNSRWAHCFDPKNTKPGTFHNYDGTDSTVDMMTAPQTVIYCESDDILMISLFFNFDSHCALNIIMPKTDKAKILPEFLWSLGWPDGFEGLKLRQALYTQLTMPKFSIASNTDLIPILKKMGLNSIFTSTNGFAGMFSGPSSMEDKAIGIFDQTISTELNEEGAKVAAVTQTGIIDSMPTILTTPEQIIIDRPFFFTISDTVLRIVLEMGWVNKL